MRMATVSCSQLSLRGKQKAHPMSLDALIPGCCRLLEVSGFDLSGEQVAKLVAAADANCNGLIEYSEFVPLAVDLLRAMKIKDDEMKAASAYTAEQLEKYMQRLFAIGDKNGDGVLQPSELQR